MEWWSIDLKIKENVCNKISNGIPEVLSFGFSITDYRLPTAVIYTRFRVLFKKMVDHT